MSSKLEKNNFTPLKNKSQYFYRKVLYCLLTTKETAPLGDLPESQKDFINIIPFSTLAAVSGGLVCSPQFLFPPQQGVEVQRHK